jgi:predicted nucleotidyltransferase
MNEQIKELAEEAGWDNHHSQFDTRIEKFAELIIKECYEQCKGQMLSNEITETCDLTYNDGVMDCAIGLLQHFGIGKLSGNNLNKVITDGAEQMSDKGYSESTKEKYNEAVKQREESLRNRSTYFGNDV